ncbi:phosphatase PAP2 family protein [Streptosporangium sp. NPDC048865]|uniref:phosphatase PAP2 family protein n=1 Tax=Streptosporangium sp. NPDC048865 TaxID=3155766 RepID=UPI00341FF3D3
MRTDSRHNFGRRLLGSTVLLGVGAGVVAWLSPGGLGEAGPVKIVDGASASAYRSVTGAVADAPSWVGTALEVATEGTLVVLGLLLVLVWWIAVRRKDAHGVGATVMIGVGTVAAYAISEALKLVVDEERPCRVVRGAGAAIAECPAVGDWSFPSNHATLAAGLAVGLAMLRPRLATVTLPLAGAAALLRVMVGVHYPHDVLAGVILAATVVVAVLFAFTPSAARLVSPLLGRLSGNDSGLVGHHGRRRPVVDGQAGQD